MACARSQDCSHLDEAEQDILDKLKASGVPKGVLERPGMHVIHECKLLNARFDIVRNVLFSDVKEYLRGKGILNEDRSQRIEKETTDSDKTGALLDLLARRGPKAYPAFREALLENKMTWLTDHLDNMDITVHDLRDHHFVGEDVARNARRSEKEESTGGTLKTSNLLRKGRSMVEKEDGHERSDSLCLLRPSSNRRQQDRKRPVTMPF